MAVNSGVEHTDAARAEQAVLKELADLCDGPITDEELEDVFYNNVKKLLKL